MYSILVGAYPFSFIRGEFTWLPYEKGIVPKKTLPLILKKNNYETHFLVSGNAKFGKKDYFYQQNLVDSITDWRQFPDEDRVDSWKMDDWKVLDKSLSILKSSKKSQFLHLFLLGTHNPYTYRKEFVRGKFKMSNRAPTSYQICLNIIDRQISEFEKKLNKILNPKDYILIVTGDHAEVFGKRYKHHSNMGQRARTLYREALKIPLLIKHPDILPLKVKKITSHVSLTPILLSFLYSDSKVFNDSFKSLSYPYLDLDFHYYSNPYTEIIFGFTHKNWKIIKYYGAYNGRYEKHLYNLLDDPNEQNNLINVDIERSKKIESLLDAVTIKKSLENNLIPFWFNAEWINRLKPALNSNGDYANLK